MLSSKRDYFDDEARRARLAAEHDETSPVIPRGAVVLSVGCGGGWEGEAGAAKRFVGLDIDPEALEYRRDRNFSSEVHLGTGESLPFANGEFTFYMARVSIMYMDIPRVFAEAFRVLGDDGALWCSCHDYHHEWSHFCTSVRRRQLKDIVFRSYVLLNGLALHLVGRTFRFPLKRSRIESFQTTGGLRRGLERAGFTDVAFPVEPHGQFVVTARKPLRQTDQTLN